MKRYRYLDIVTDQGIEIRLEEYIEVKKTPRGAWVIPTYQSHTYGRKRFVRDGAGKRLCHQSKALAWASFIARKQRQRLKGKESLQRAAYALKQASLLDSAPESSLLLGKPNFWFNYNID